MTQLQNLTDRSVKIIVLFLVSVNRNVSLFRIVNRNQNIPEVFLQYQKLIGENFNYRREIIPLYSDSELKQLTMPTILFVGEKDVIFHSTKTAKRLGIYFLMQILTLYRRPDMPLLILRIG